MLVMAMVACSLMLWVAVPLGWLWVGSQVQAKTDSLGPALLVMAAGVAVSIGLLVYILGHVNRRYLKTRGLSKFAEHHEPSIRGITKSGRIGAIEIIMVSTAVVGVIVFIVWFMTFGGTGSVAPDIGG